MNHLNKMKKHPKLDNLELLLDSLTNKLFIINLKPYPGLYCYFKILLEKFNGNIIFL